MLDIVDLFGGEDGNRTHHRKGASLSRLLGTCLPKLEGGFGTFLPVLALPPWLRFCACLAHALFRRTR